MKKILLLLFSFLHCSQFLCLAQCNLVPNPSFEIDTNCANGVAGLQQGFAPPWDSPTSGSPDLFNTCSVFNGTRVPFNTFGFQNAHIGNGYSNIITIYPYSNGRREYIQVELDSALIANEMYCVSFYVNPSDSTGLGSNNIGMYFSTTHTSIPTNVYLSIYPNFIPQINFTYVITDTANWTEISGTYTVQGGERYIIIGNFFPDASTDTLAFQTTRPWTLRLGYFFIDDVDVHRCSCNVGIDELKNEMSFNLSPNPNNGQMQFNYSLKNNETAVLKLYDILGKEIREYKLLQGNTTLTINEENLNSGIYFYKLILNQSLIKSDKLVIVK